MSFDALDISASALYAQRVRMDTIASNIANVNTTRTADGTPGPYKRKEAVFKAIYNDSIKQYNPSNQNFGAQDLTSSTGNHMLKGRVDYNAPNVANGVEIEQVQDDTKTPFRKEYNPSHPDADKDGYVNMPNVNIVTEMVDMISASRAYEANVTTIDTTKNIFSAALRI